MFPNFLKKLHNLSNNILFLLAIFPAALLGFLIHSYAVDVPYWDQWAVATLFEKINNNSLYFSDLIAQHNESRKFFPRLLFIGLAYFTHWDVRYEMLVIFLLACIVSLNLYYLSNLTIQGGTNKKLLIAGISNLLIFAPIQWENWLWGIQIVVFVPIVCITSCVLLTYSRLDIKAKFGLGICLSTISTFSYANGILCWIIVFPILFLKWKNGLSKNKWLIFAWIFAFTVNAVTYFYNYQKPPHHPSFSEGLIHPLHAIHYFLSFLGAPLSFGNTSSRLIIGPLIGFALILLFLASCTYLLKFVNDSFLLHNMAGWLTIGIYTVISGIITTSGRVGFGVQQSLDSRYTTFSIYLIVSLVYIVVIIYDDLQKKNLLNKYKKRFQRYVYVFTGIILVLHLLTSMQAIGSMNNLRKDRLLAKSCLQFINILPDECLTKKVYPDLAHLKRYANAIDKLGLLRPHLVKNIIIEDTKQAHQVSQKNYGWFDNLTKDINGSYIASGWAVLPDRGEPADSVILTYEIAKGQFKMFSLVNDVKMERIDVAKSLNKSTYLKSGWQKDFSVNNITSGSIKLVAWGFDANTGKYFQLNGSHIIQK